MISSSLRAMLCRLEEAVRFGVWRRKAYQIVVMADDRIRPSRLKSGRPCNRAGAAMARSGRSGNFCRETSVIFMAMASSNGMCCSTDFGALIAACSSISAFAAIRAFSTKYTISARLMADTPMWFPSASVLSMNKEAALPSPGSEKRYQIAV